jgi:glycosyltransferase involved in cell wall biosynthesis
MNCPFFHRDYLGCYQRFLFSVLDSHRPQARCLHNRAPVRKLQVAIVAPTLAILGGHSVQAAALIRGWANDADINAWLVPINPTPPALVRFATSVKYLRTIVTQATYLPLLVRELSRADIVHVFSASYWSFLLAPLPAMVVARALGRPVVLNYHSGEAQDHLARSPLARLALARADRRVVPSKFLASVFSSAGLDARVVPNTIDLDRFVFRERRPLPPRVLSTRNLCAPYNVACTILAFREVQAELPNASLTLVGAGPDTGRLKEMVSAMALRHVSFLGRVEPSAMPAIYDSHDIYVQTPDVDNMPLSVLEAFASGLPVISTDVGGVRDLLDGGLQGLLAAPGNHQAVARSIIDCLIRPEEARARARRAREAVEAYAWSEVRRSWLEIYRHTLPGRMPAMHGANI